MKRLVVLFALLATPALAQQPPSTVDQLIAAHANIEANLAKQLDAAHAEIAKLNADILQMKKAEEKKPEPKK